MFEKKRCQQQCLWGTQIWGVRHRKSCKHGCICIQQIFKEIVAHRSNQMCHLVIFLCAVELEGWMVASDLGKTRQKEAQIEQENTSDVPAN